ncbi:MAG: SxtJ family membrane protein [Cocleimonas sp.]|nr:SxtJ family membrane protein [Cocleimonas sp.]
MSNEINTAEVTTSDLRKFGFIMGGMFALIFGLIFPWLGDKTSETWPLWPFIVMAIFWLISIAAPQILRPVNDIWIKIGNVLGFINSRIILGVMFFVMIFPIGMLLRLFGKDSMNRKLDKNADTYRKISKVRNKEHLEKPF